MTIEGLKQQFIDKTAEILNGVEDTENLYKLAEVYSELTKEDWAKKAFQSLSDMQNHTSDFALTKPEIQKLGEQEENNHEF